MLLKIYIGTIIFFYVGILIYAVDTIAKIKNSGLKKTKSNKKPEIRFLVQLLIYSLIPIFNVCMGFIYIFSKTLYKTMDDQINKAKEEQGDKNG